MNFRIIKIETCGMKGLDKPIAFQFQNDTIDFKAFDKPSVKAIYGQNGSGKSSFITAIDVYKGVCTSFSYLVSDSTSTALNDLVNKKTGRFEIRVYFAVSSFKTVFCHELVISCRTSRPYIEREKISKIKGRTINSELVDIIHVERNNLVYYSGHPTMNKADSFLRNALMKKNEYCSMLAMFCDENFLTEFADSIDEKSKSSLDFNTDYAMFAMMCLDQFLFRVCVFLNESDIHRDSASSPLSGEFYFDADNENHPVVAGKRSIEKNKLGEYEAQVRKLARFIRLFKPELRRIDIDKRINGEKYFCSLVMDYGDYSVDYEYESTGLRNLISMFSCLEQASTGNIAFIDEMDANMNEVYLEKLCEFFVNHGKGQLCFTTHNTAPMNILKKQKYGIDFINNDIQSIQWVRNGNYSPSKLYSEGMIPGLPFNIEDFDFLSVFFPEEK